MTQRIYIQHLRYSLQQENATDFMQKEVETHIHLAQALIRRDLEGALFYMQKDMEDTKVDVMNKFQAIDTYSKSASRETGESI